MRWWLPLTASLALACDQVDYIEIEPGEVFFKQANNEAFLSARCMALTGKRAEKAEVDWSVADPEVATINRRGQLKPLKTGNTEAIARYGSKEARIPVSVVFVERIELNPTNLTFVEGDPARTVEVKAFDNKGTWLKDRKPTFTSKDKAVVSVGGGGILPLDPGTATVEVNVEGAKANLTVTVEPDKKSKKR